MGNAASGPVVAVAANATPPAPPPTSNTISTSNTSSNNSTAVPPPAVVEPPAPAAEGFSMRSFCPVSKKEATEGGQSECPISTKYKNKDVYNVYSQKIDPTNNMPATANQEPIKPQSIPLSKERVKSTIPKAGTESDTWVYPSPQMFWNALVRKNKSDGAAEEDMDTVIKIHNNMNENTWNQVLAWEKLHAVEEEDKQPKLLRFTGRPDELSPRAQLKVLFGHPAPFDRHDWIVDRGGKEVRYIIDYYSDESAADKDSTPKHMHDSTSMKSISVDVRPALESFESVLDRTIVMPIFKFQGKTNYNPPPFFAPSAMQEAENKNTKRLNQAWSDIKLNCEKNKIDLSMCTTDEECRNASIDLQRCMANIVCPEITRDFNLAVEAVKEKKVTEEEASVKYSKMTKCLDEFKLDSARLMGSGK